MQIRQRSIITLGALAGALVLGLVLGQRNVSFVHRAFAQDAPPPAASPVKALAEQDVYFPGTEDLGPNEMRVTACGTGMPNARPKQAAACWLVELGNGDKFIFDIGTGSAERLSALKIPYDYLDTVFIGHLHSDTWCSTSPRKTLRYGWRRSTKTSGRNRPRSRSGLRI